MRVYSVVLFLFLCGTCFSQTGIGTNNIHESAMLEIKSETKGLLIPRVSTRFAVEDNAGTVAEGLFIYDNSAQLYYAYINGRWHKVNPWETTPNGNLKNNTKVGIGTNPDSGIEKLQVEGEIKSTGDITVSESGQFNGYGTIPLGGIIIWAGSNVPDGWALCNGQTVNGYQTPNLEGRFVVGKTVFDDIGDLSEGGTTPSDAGGQTNVHLQKENLPRHKHGTGTLTVTGNGNHTHIYAYDYSRTDGDEPGNEDIVLSKQGATNNQSETITYNGGSHTHGLSGQTEDGSSDQLQGEPFDNRPPYYVIAYIMRVK